MKLVLLGAPGAGKGTVAEKIAAHFNMVHISTGDIFRAAIRSGSELGNKVKAVIESGGLVSDDLTISLVKEKLCSSNSPNSWLLDGFPRTIQQAEALNEFCHPDYVLNIDVSDEIVIERLAGRRMCKCGKSYHIKFMKPKVEGICDTCGNKLFTRDDDNESSVLTRLKNYKVQTSPLIDYYKQNDILLSVNGGQDSKLVWNDVKTVLESKK